MCRGWLESAAPDAIQVRGGLRMATGRRLGFRPGRRTNRCLLAHEHDVTGAHLEVMLRSVLHRLVIVEADPAGTRPLAPQDDDAGTRCEFGQTPRERQEIQDRGASLEIEAAGVRHLPENG